MTLTAIAAILAEGLFLAAALRGAEPPPDLPRPPDINATVERVLSLPDFRPPERTLLQRVWDWVDETFLSLLSWILSRVNEAIERPLVSQVIMIVLTVILIVLLLHLIWTILALKEPLPGKPSRPPVVSATSLSPEPHLTAAAEFAASGRYLAACRSLYLGVILWLDGTGSARYQESKTGSEYARELAGSPLVQPFRRLLGIFYPVAYGGRPAGRDLFEEMRSAAVSMGVPA